MVSFGGEQSLERYLALSARGIPFNFAHAVGNAAIMFAAGPALVRIVDRYRDRFEVEWEPLASPAAASRQCSSVRRSRTSLLGRALPALLCSPASAQAPAASDGSEQRCELAAHGAGR